MIVIAGSAERDERKDARNGARSEGARERNKEQGNGGSGQGCTSRGLGEEGWQMMRQTVGEELERRREGTGGGDSAL